MNRRNFLEKAKALLIYSTAVPIIGNSLNIRDVYTPKDSLNNAKSQLLYNDDIYLNEKYLPIFKSVIKKLSYVQRHVGYGNFNIISFDQTFNVLRYGRNVKRFTKDELDFLEYIFYYEPKYHGFYGDRITTQLTSIINKKDVEKIPYTGHYLFKGKPKSTYLKMKDDIGNTLVLTSGVRSVVKQTKLFLDKLNSVNGNLSQTSRSIAPPAFTYHSVGDFDVGKKGFGTSNFTARFSFTEEFLKMKNLKYIDMRYTIGNKDGVRYEPWHVKVI